ncbi:hypothetical protein DH2020_041072 [Rehmannia glutinosa]|uniref:Uncharacterized protein n=1 Tax=Rehmannia glutinosa TaxID=99300 RepID=A0ABR0UT85_REHGL
MAIPLLILSFLTIFIAYKLFQRLRFKLPPGPRPLPIVGNLYDLKPVLVRCFTEWSQIYGPIFSVYLGSHLSVVVNSAELAKEVLKDNDQQLANRNRTRQIAKFSKNGMDLIWSDYGPHYVKVRKLCTLELFSMKRIDALRPIREDEVTAMVESIFKDCVKPADCGPAGFNLVLKNKGKALVLREYLGMMAFLHITRLSFGKRFMDSNGVIDQQGEELKGILNNGIKLGTKKSFAEFLPWLRFLFKAENEALAEHDARADSFTKKIMEEHTIARKKTGNTKSHFVDALLTLQKEYDLSEDTIIGLLWDMISAGMDTTTITVEWAMAEMNAPSDTADAPHKANTNVKIGGYDVPKGATVSVNAWAIAGTQLSGKTLSSSDREVSRGGHRHEGDRLSATSVRLRPAGVRPEDMDMMEQPGTVTYMRTPLQAVPTPRLSADLFKRVAVGNV